MTQTSEEQKKPTRAQLQTEIKALRKKAFLYLGHAMGAAIVAMLCLKVADEENSHLREGLKTFFTLEAKADKEYCSLFLQEEKEDLPLVKERCKKVPKTDRTASKEEYKDIYDRILKIRTEQDAIIKQAGKGEKVRDIAKGGYISLVFLGVAFFGVASYSIKKEKKATKALETYDIK